MNDLPPRNQAAIQELKVSAHLMALEPGVFCVFQSPGQTPPDGTGLPGVRVSAPPGLAAGELAVDLAGFRADGWVGEYNDAVLVRVRTTTQLLVTIYQRAGDAGRPPHLQVVRVGNVQPPPPAVPVDEPMPPAIVAVAAAAPQLSAHIQARGDVPGKIGQWLGEPGSGRWIEGYQVMPPEGVVAEDIEYQAVLGRGWLSPWVAAGEFCGSRGMALPILGLRVRLRGAAAEAWDLSLEASFTDGTRVGPVASGTAVESETLSPLEAFLLQLEPKTSSSTTMPEPTSDVKAAPARGRLLARRRAR